MSVYVVCDGTTYSNVKSVSFVPEDDLTLNTLPICQFSVDIVTSTAADSFRGKYIHLHESRVGNPVLLAGKYTVTEAEQIAPGVVRIVAKSFLEYLDKRILAPILYTTKQRITAGQFLVRTFSGPAENEYEGTILWDSSAPQLRIVNADSIFVYGFFPRQTARERLQMFCQAQNHYVVQWGPDSEYGLFLRQRTANSFVGSDYILPEDIYRQPIVKRASDIGTLNVYGHYNFTTTYHDQTDGWNKYIVSEGWADPDTGLTQDEAAYYYKSDLYTFTSGDGARGVEEIKNNLFMGTNPTLSALRLVLFAHYEVELETLCTYDLHYNTETTRVWYPGNFVNFCIDDSGTRYCGIIKSAEYTFGKMTKVKLKIVTDMVSADTSTLVVEYIGSGGYGTIMRRVYNLPPNTRLCMYHPQILTCWISDHVVSFERTDDTASSFATPAVGQTYTYQVYYNAIT